jgi:hypothetical protein
VPPALARLAAALYPRGERAVKGVRLVAVGAAGLVLVSVGVTLASPGDELGACRSTLNGKPQVTIRSDRWVRIGAPKFDAGEGPSTITAFSAMPVRKNGMLVTNGRVIKLSADAGCTWQTIYSGNNIHSPNPQYTPDNFTQIVEPQDNIAWVASYDDVNGVPKPNVYFGTNIGESGATPVFNQLDVGLPAYGKPVELGAGPIGEDEGYVLIDSLPNAQSGDLTTTSRHLYTTFVQSNPPTGAVTGPQWEDITPTSGFGRIDGFVRETGRKIWIWSGSQYAWATNVDQSPVTWHAASAPGRIADIDVDSYGVVSVIARASQGEGLYHVTHDGALTADLGVPIEPYDGAVAHGTFQGVFVVSGAKGTWGYDHIRHLWVNISPRNGPTFHSLTMTLGTSARIVLGMTSSALWRWDTYTQEAFRPPPPGPPSVGNPDSVTLPKSKLTHPVLSPVKQVVTVSPGQVSQVPVQYLVNPDPTPLDVYFLVDTTGSMEPAILGLQKSALSIAQKLRNQLGKAACFGVGGVKDVTPDTTVNEASTNTYIFKTFLPVAPCDTAPDLSQVRTALRNLVQGGGGDIPEAQTLALKLALTGGTSVFPPVPTPQPANFRPGAFHVIVYISDSGSHEDDSEGYPTVPEVVQTLNVNDVKVVSVAIKDGSGGDLNGALSMMNRMAVGTGSYAPPSGVDCNGDGGHQYGDLAPGAPLVCEEPVISDSNGGIVTLGPAIVGLLLAVKDPGTINVQVADPHHALQGPIDGKTGGVFDMKFENGLRFTMPVGCTTNQAGQTLPIYLSPYVRSQPDAGTGEVDVQCRVVPKLPPVPPIVQAAPLIITPIIRPPVAVPPPAPPNPPFQAPSNLNPNAGMAREEQQQPQLAMAAQGSAEEGEDTEVVEMSAMRNPPSNSNAMFLTGAALLMAAAAGCSMQLRRRTAYVRQGR